MRQKLCALLILVPLFAQAENWPQAAGPGFDWRAPEGEAPAEWSVVRGENIRWRSPMPECGQSAVTVWGDRLFVTTHEPLETLEDRFAAHDLVGHCLDADTGEVLWSVDLPGSISMEPAGGFTDATVFAPVTDGEHVWFFNRCGSMGCYTFGGEEVWLRYYPLRFKHSNRQCEPVLINGTILNVEVADKANGQLLRKFAPGTSNARFVEIPDDIDPRQLWTYIHGIDAATGEIVWREDVGTCVHDTPVVGHLADGTPAVVHARGGAHGPLEKPAGVSLSSLAPGHEGETLWSTEIPGCDPVYSNHWDEDFVYVFGDSSHLVLSTETGEIVCRQPLYEGADLWRFDPKAGDWLHEEDAEVTAGKRGHPCTNHANMVVGDWHYFLSHNVHYIGRVHLKTGAVEYLEVPAQLIASPDSRDKDERLWGKGAPDNRPTNANGLAIGRKGHTGTGWGHISAASPLLVGDLLYLPVVTGTVYVIDTTATQLNPDALVAINDLGPGRETRTLASLSYANGLLYAHTMREVICIGGE